MRLALFWTDVEGVEGGGGGGGAQTDSWTWVESTNSSPKSNKVKNVHATRLNKD